VARLDPQERYKGHDLILDALALLRQRGALPAALRWRVVGEGEDRPRLQARAAALGLQAHIDWLGALDDASLRQDYRDCSLVVMPSAFGLRSDGSARGEGFGITYLEAALAARASIAADQGGQTDLILHGQTGWLLPPSAKTLADLLWRLQEDPERVRLCGERALAHASRHFSPKRQRRLLAELVAPWLGSGSPGPRP
jgi:phosphatidylinositol alpha-1,6-mannosyltransferase